MRAVTERGATGVLLLPADLPLIKTADIAALIRRDEATPLVRLAAAARDHGTNAMALWPTGIIAPQYGGRSYEAHLGAASACGAPVEIVDLRRLTLDIDRPADIAALRRFEPGAHTARALRLPPRARPGGRIPAAGRAPDGRARTENKGRMKWK